MTEFDKRTEVAIPLNFPVTVEDETYDSLTMRRPKTKDQLAISKHNGTDADRGVLLFARLCNVSPDVIEELDEFDADKLGMQHRAFTGRQSA